MEAQVISFRCTLSNRLGHFISDSFNNEVINQKHSNGDHLEGLVAGLQGVKPGEKRRIVVIAEEAYGLYDPSLVREIPKSELHSDFELELGKEIWLPVGRDKQQRAFRVVGATAECVVLDANHPLAGQDLVFDVEITAARKLRHDDVAPLRPRYH